MPSFPRRLVGCTHRLFRRFERSMDKFVGITGPLFVFFAIILLIPCTVAFCGCLSYIIDISKLIKYSVEVVFPYNFPPTHPTSRYTALFYCLWHATMIFYHYYCAITVSPGFSASYVGGDVRVCQKCNQVKPERTHHCKVCKRCILKYDHHCPWINQCVGLHNERYFVLFMFYLSTASFIVVWLGFSPVIKLAMPVRKSTNQDVKDAWIYRTPAFVVVLLWVLAIFIGLAVAIMLLWQLYLIIRAESSVENQDNSVFRKSYEEDYKKWSERGHMDKQVKPQEIINPYDFGVYNNLCLFFNVGKGRWSWLMLLVPMKIPATSDGYTYPKLTKQGLHLSFDSDSELDGEINQP